MANLYSVNFGTAKAGAGYSYTVYDGTTGAAGAAGAGTLDSNGQAAFSAGTGPADAVLVATTDASPAYLVDGLTAFNFGPSLAGSSWGYSVNSGSGFGSRSTTGVVSLGHGCGFVTTAGIAASVAGVVRYDAGASSGVYAIASLPGTSAGGGGPVGTGSGNFAGSGSNNGSGVFA